MVNIWSWWNTAESDSLLSALFIINGFLLFFFFFFFILLSLAPPFLLAPSLLSLTLACELSRSSIGLRPHTDLYRSTLWVCVFTSPEVWGKITLSQSGSWLRVGRVFIAMRPWHVNTVQTAGFSPDSNKMKWKLVLSGSTVERQCIGIPWTAWFSTFCTMMYLVVDIHFCHTPSRSACPGLTEEGEDLRLKLSFFRSTRPGE